MPAIALIAAYLLLAGGCASPSAGTTGGAPAPAAAGGGMSMGGGGGLGADPMTGVIAAPGKAAVDFGASVESSSGIVVARVLSPVPSWIVVRSTNPPGGVLGATRVPAGESREVPVAFTALDGPWVQVELHVDRGTEGTLEFDPLQPARSPDKLVFVGSAPVARTVGLRGYGVGALANTVQLIVEDQPGARGTLRLRRLFVPSPSWVSVNLLEKGLPGRQVGLFHEAAGEFQDVDVPLDGTLLTDQVVVTAWADGGRIGVFEWVPSRWLDSPDKPWIALGVPVSQRVRVK